MAGHLVAMSSENMEKSVIAFIGSWEVQYSRFFNNPALSHTHPSLQFNRLKGTWISSSSPSVFLKLAPHHSSSDSVLIITYRQKILEEHCISNLHFSWPQVSCMSGFPVKGSRVVLVSYRGCVGQIQKFALRFLTNNETEQFMNALKEIIGPANTRPPCADGSEISSQSEFVPSTGLYRPEENWSSTSFAETGTNHISQNNLIVAQSSNSEETERGHDGDGNFSALPPSFTSLLMKYCPPVEEVVVAAQPAISEEINLKTQITRYLADSSFQDMLSKVERIINEMGENMLL